MTVARYQTPPTLPVFGPDLLDPVTAEGQFKLRCLNIPVPKLLGLTKEDAGSESERAKEAAERLLKNESLWVAYNSAVLALLEQATTMSQFDILVKHMSGCLTNWAEFLPRAEAKFQEPKFFDPIIARQLLDHKEVAMDMELRLFLEAYLSRFLKTQNV